MPADRDSRKGRRPKPKRAAGNFPTFGLTQGHLAPLVLVALGLRLAHVFALRQSPYFDHPIIDGLTYHQAALSIAAGQGHPDLVFWQPPGYSYFLALLYKLGGPANLLLPRLVQCALGAAVAAMTAWLGAAFFGRRVGLAAGYIVALFGTLIHFDGELLGASLTVFLQLVAVSLAVLAGGVSGNKQAGDAAAPPRPRLWLAAGVVTGLAALVTATSLVLVPLFGLAARRNYLAVVLGAALAVAPVTLRNATRGHEFVPLSSNGGINLYIGNNPEYDRTVGIRPDRHWAEFTKEPFERGIHTQGGASLYWTKRSLEWAAHEPAAFLALQLRKLRLFLGGDEIYRNQAIYPTRRHSPVLAALLWKTPWLAFPFGVLAPLAAIGLFVAWRRARLLAGVVLLYAAAVIAFFIAARYRAPLVPYLAVFAAAGVAWLVSPAPGAAITRRAAAVAALVPLYLLCNARQGSMAAEMNADAEFSLGESLRQEGRYPEARAHFQNAVHERRDCVEAWVNLGGLEMSQGRVEEAARALETALEIAPDQLEAILGLASVRERQQRWDDAAALYRRAMVVEPADPFAAQRLGALEARGVQAKK